MKTKLLSLIAMLLIAVGAKAEEITPAFSALAEGDFYLYNVEYKGFLVGANNWGTRASVSREKGLKVTISEVDGGTYKIGAMSPDKADDVWVDGSRNGNDQFTFTAGENSTYTIGCTKFAETYLTWTGDEYNTRLNFTAEATNGTWALVSQNDYDAYWQALEDAGDFTHRIPNNTFEGLEKAVAGWTSTTKAQNNAIATNKSNPAEYPGTTFTGNFYENWNGSAFAGKMYTTVDNLPMGLYEVSMDATTNAGEDTWVYANKSFTRTGGVDANGNTDLAMGATPYRFTVQTLVEDGGSIELGIINKSASSNWLGIDNVTLTRVRDLTAEEIAQLKIAELTIAEKSGVYTVSSDKDYALYTLCKPFSWLDEGETPESCLQSEIEGMGSMIDSEETWELYDHMGMKPAPKKFDIDAYKEMYGGEPMFLVAANVGWSEEEGKLSVLSNVEKVVFTVPSLPESVDVLTNANFAEGVVGDVNIATYAKDGNPNQMQAVPGWEFGVENGDARAAGVVAYGSAATLGGSAYTVPAAGPEGTNGKALAMVGVWTGTVQYVQDVTLPAGKYVMVVPVYNTAGTTDFVKNLIGVKIGETENYATSKNYAVGQWTKETINFELAEETTVTVSLGYEGANVGSGASQHLFIDKVSIEKLADDAYATMDIKAENGLATFCAPFEAPIPANVKAYTAKIKSVGDADIVVLTEIKNTIPANTPVIVESENDINVAFCGPVTEGEPKVGALIGTYTEITAPANTYVLAHPEGMDVAFYAVPAEYKVAANKCYITYKAGEAPLRIVFGDDATAINTVAAEAQKEGKFIENGRVVIVKNGQKFNVAGQIVK